MKAILIDPINKRVLRVNVATPEDAARALGYSSLVQIQVDGRRVLLLDAAQRLDPPHPDGYFLLGGTAFGGRGLILATYESADADALLDLASVSLAVSWCGTPYNPEVN